MLVLQRPNGKFVLLWYICFSCALPISKYVNEIRNVSFKKSYFLDCKHHLDLKYEVWFWKTGSKFKAKTKTSWNISLKLVLIWWCLKTCNKTHKFWNLSWFIMCIFIESRRRTHVYFKKISFIFSHKNV